MSSPQPARRSGSKGLLPPLLLFPFALIGCGATRTPAVPADVPDPLPWGAVAREGREPVRELGALAALDPTRLPDADGDGRLEYHALALSAGGSYGAFGAGFLDGWTETGTRPEFQVVTGISTGALMATSAFLGPEEDEELRSAWTETSEKDLFKRRWVFAAFYAAAMTDNRRLRALLEEAVTPELVDTVASEHRAGRRLFVATTYVDREAFVIWDLGAIAASGRADRVERYHDVLMAASAIPAFFPPVYFDVEVDGEAYSQMHADSAHDSAFLRPYLLHPDAFGGELDVTVHVLVNHPLDGHGRERMKPRVLALAMGHSMNLVSTVHQQSVTRIYLLAAAQGFAYRLASIPPRTVIDFPEIEFEEESMSGLYELGRSRALEAGSWLDRPPFLEDEELLPDAH